MTFLEKKKLAVGGVYSPEEIEQARKLLFFPQMRDRGITEMMEKIYKDGNYVPNYDYLFGPNHFKEAAKNVAYHIWGRFAAFGTFIARCTGIYVVLLLIKVVLSQFCPL